MMGGAAAPEGSAEISGALSVGGNNWYLYYDDMKCFWSAGSRTRANTIRIHGLEGKIQAFIEINLYGTPYARYALYKKGDVDIRNEISGRLLFPDGYVDQTDCISTEALLSEKASCEISYDAFEKMVAAGVMFFTQAGNYFDGAYYLTESSGLSYHLGKTDSANPIKKNLYRRNRLS